MEIGWRSSKDGPLLEFAQRQFDVFVTIDRGLERQNDLSRVTMGFVIVAVESNRIECYEPLFDRIRTAAGTVKPGEMSAVPAGFR